MYGRGEGWEDDEEWEQFNQAQLKAADAHRDAAARLRAAAQAMASGELGAEEQHTIKQYERTFGADTASTDAMLTAADRYDIAESILRDTETFKADGMSLSQFLGGEGVDPRMAAYVDGDKTRVRVNKDHDGFWTDRLVWDMAHEPFHNEGLRLSDQKVGDEFAYWRGDQPRRRAFNRLAPEKRALNPEHLAKFSMDLKRGR